MRFGHCLCLSCAVGLALFEGCGGSGNSPFHPVSRDGSAGMAGSAGYDASATGGSGGSTGGSGGSGATGGTAGGATGGSAGASTGGSAGASTGGSAGASTGGSAGASTGGSAGASTGGSAGASTGGSAGASTGGSAGASTGGSAGASTGGSAGASTGGSAGASTGGSAGASTGGSAGASGAGGGDACSPVTWCPDQDQDGYGNDDSTTWVKSCTAPGTNWVEESSSKGCTDCDDADANVHPGSTYCGAMGYPVPGGNGAVSFDYNCDGSETECNTPPHAGFCSGSPGNCNGSGYEPTNRFGNNVNAYCGSTLYQVCGPVGALACASQFHTRTADTCN